MKAAFFKPLLFLACLMIISCSKTESFPEPVDLVPDNDIFSGLVFRGKSLQDQLVTFKVFDTTGVELTANTTFYVDGNPINGNTFSSASEGIFEVYGEYLFNGDLIATDIENFEVIVPKRKVVLEDYTGAWCGYCPRMTAAIEVVHGLTDDMMAVAIHNEDEMAHPQEEVLRQEFGVSGFPHGRINRTTNWVFPHYPEVATAIAGQPTNIAIAISSEIVGNNLEVEVRLTSATAIASDKLVVYLLEDGILSDQTNYFDNDPDSPYYQMGNPIIDFVNNDVLRESFTNILGDPIPQTGALTEYSRNFTSSLSSNYNQGNLKLAVMVVTNDNTARNAQFAPVNEVKDYE